MEVVLTQEELVELCVEWQERLRLQDWDIEVKLVRQTEIANPNWQAQCNINFSNSDALIKVMDNIDYANIHQVDAQQDMEHSLVHELVHILFQQADKTAKDSVEELILEQAINKIAGALLKLKRQTP